MSVQMVGWGSSLSISSDGLTVSRTSSSSIYWGARCNTTIPITAATKRMYEIRVNAMASAAEMGIGIMDSSVGSQGSFQFGRDPKEYAYRGDGSKITNYVATAYGLSFGVGDVIGVLIDIPATLSEGIKLSFAKNGSVQGVAYTITNITNSIAVGCRFYTPTASITYNFGDITSSFDYPIEGYNTYLGDTVRSETMSFEGFSIDEDFALVRSCDRLGLYLEDQLIGSRLISDNMALEIDPPLLGDRLIANSQGSVTDHLLTGNRLIANNPGTSIDDIKSGQWSSSSPGAKLDNVLFGERRSASSQFAELIEVDTGYRSRSRNYEGVEVGEVIAQSSAEHVYLLTVNPTHQFRNQVVTVNFHTRTGLVINGKYRLIIGENEIVPYSSENVDITNVTFTISPNILATGVNYGRIQLLYSNGTTEYLDFQILKEDKKRTLVERLFREYDGGFSGVHVSPPYICASNIFPSFLAPYDQSTTIIQTTDTTRISLSKYLNIQGVNIVGEGLKILVSFDKGITWKSIINNSWQVIDISNISLSGMTKDTVNGITIAQWSDIFKPTSLDFAILFTNADSYTSIPGDQETSFLYGDLAANQSATYLSSIFDSSVKFIKTNAKLRTTNGTITITTNNNVYSIHPATDYTDYYIPYNELASKMVFATGANTTMAYTIYTQPKRAYLKSINVQITPNPKTGYAFIM